MATGRTGIETIDTIDRVGTAETGVTIVVTAECAAHENLTSESAMAGIAAAASSQAPPGRPPAPDAGALIILSLAALSNTATYLVCHSLSSLGNRADEFFVLAFALAIWLQKEPIFLVKHGSLLTRINNSLVCRTGGDEWEMTPGTSRRGSVARSPWTSRGGDTPVRGASQVPPCSACRPFLPSPHALAALLRSADWPASELSYLCLHS